MKTKNIHYQNFRFIDGFAIQSKETINYCPETFPNIFFTNLVSRNACSICVSQMIPFLEFISLQHNLKLNRAKEFKIAKTILLNSINFN